MTMIPRRSSLLDHNFYYLYYRIRIHTNAFSESDLNLCPRAKKF